MAPLTCGCDRDGTARCDTAAKLWRSYVAVKEVREALHFLGPTDDPVQHDRRRLADEAEWSCLRRYERHVDGYDEPAPEPQSLRAKPDLRVVS